VGVDYGKVKQRTKAIWSVGDYRPLAMLLEPAAHDLVDACGIAAGQDVLDVAAGNGNCAMAVARRGARVVASDLTPALVQLGRARTQAEGLAIQWAEADAESLPFADGRFDCVTSVFGAMFAPRPEVTAAELFRVLRSGGSVGMANWTPASFGKQLTEVAAKYGLPRPVELPSPFRWGEEQTVRSLFEGLASSIRLEQRVLRWEFESLAAMRAVFEAQGGVVMAKQMLPPEVYERMGREFETVASRRNQGSGDRVVINNEYLLVVARKT
jgi:SAM-dependent methyltransferase